MGVEVEEGGEFLGGLRVVGEEALCARAALGAIVVEQDGFLDTAQLVEDLAGGEFDAGVFGLAGHQVGGLQGEDAGERVDADVVIGPVVHGREGHDVGVFELPEGVLDVGLGPVSVLLWRL